MSQKPRPPQEKLLTSKDLVSLFIEGAVIGAVTLISFILGYYCFQADLGQARTMAFCTLSFSQLVQVFNCRNWFESVFKIGIFSNMYLIYAVIFSIIMQLIVLYLPVLQKIFKTESVTMGQFLIVILLSFVPLLLSEVTKIKRRRNVTL